MMGFAFMQRLPERGVLHRLEESEDGGQRVTEGWGVGGAGQRANSYVYLR